MRRSFRTLRLCAYTRGFTPGWYAVPRLGTPKASPPPSFPASIGPVPRGPKKPQRSGIGPMHALEAIKPFHRAQRESRSSPELPCVHRTGPAEPQKIAAERDRSEACTGSNQTLPSRTARKLILPRSLPACIGPVPRSPKKSQRSGIGPMHALEAIKPIPSRTARKPILPRAYLRASGRSRGARLLILLASPQPSR